MQSDEILKKVLNNNLSVQTHKILQSVDKRNRTKSQNLNKEEDSMKFTTKKSRNET